MNWGKEKQNEHDIGDKFKDLGFDLNNYYERNDIIGLPKIGKF